MSKKYPKNLRVRNESSIRKKKKYIIGKGPCEVSVVVKYIACVKECGAQNQNLPFVFKIIKIRRKFICFKCKMSKQLKCVVACAFTAAFKNLCQLHSQQHISTQHDMLPQRPV